MSKTPRINDIEKVVHEGKVNTPFAAVPHTTTISLVSNTRGIAVSFTFSQLEEIVNPEITTEWT